MLGANYVLSISIINRNYFIQMIPYILENFINIILNIIESIVKVNYKTLMKQ